MYSISRPSTVPAATMPPGPRHACVALAGALLKNRPVRISHKHKSPTSDAERIVRSSAEKHAVFTRDRTTVSVPAS